MNSSSHNRESDSRAGASPVTHVEAGERMPVRDSVTSRRAGRIRLGLRMVLWTAFAVEVGLWLTGRQILLTETRVRPGDPPFLVEEYGDLAKMEASSLVCRYFNGRRMLERVYSYAANDIMGRSACPATLNDRGE